MTAKKSTTARPKNPKVLKPLPGLSDTARATLGLPKCAPRVRHPDEATPRQISNATTCTKVHYKPGDGDAPVFIRPGGMQALAVESRGYRT